MSSPGREREAVELAGILCSRMAHDLVGPSGALANGLELLREERDPDGIRDIVSMLEKSAASLNARLQFYRLAFGMASGLGEEIDSGFLRKSLVHLLDHMRVALTWEVAAPRMAKNDAKILLNLALALAECLVRGGDLCVREDGGGMVIVSEGLRLIVPDELIDLLQTPDAPAAPGPRTAPLALALSVAEACGRRIRLEEYRPSGDLPPQEGGRARLCVRISGR